MSVCLCGQCLENSSSNCPHRQTNRHYPGLAPRAAPPLWTGNGQLAGGGQHGWGGPGGKGPGGGGARTGGEGPTGALCTGFTLVYYKEEIGELFPSLGHDMSYELDC